MRYLALLLLTISSLPLNANVYSIRSDISQRELLGVYVDMLTKFSRYAEDQWRDADFGSAGYWGNGVSGGNEGIRAVANTALTYAGLVKHTDALDPKTARHYTDRAAAGIRYAAETHLTGSQKCVDGKQWGNSWQSAMWAANMGFAAWILWDELDAELRKSVERVVAYEADRFLERQPPGRRYGDTKAEENGWDQICISLAPNMFPDHPNADRWREKSIEYMMNTLSAPQDSRDERIVDGRMVKDWVSTVNVHSDFTLENHGFFHPTYAMVSPAEIGQGSLLYAYAGNPIPEAAGHHLRDSWNLLQGFMQPCGFWIYSQGMDWALNGDPHIVYLAWLATYAKDPLAAGMEKTLAQYASGFQAIHGDGRIAGPSSRLKFAREAIWGERLTYAYLSHLFVGPAPENTETIRQASVRLNGVRRYIFTDIIAHRTDNKFASFSWKNTIMGLLMPIGPGHEGNPLFSTPHTGGFIGRIESPESPDQRPQVISRSWRKTPNGFATEGILSRNGGAVRQELTFISAGEQTVVYLDKVTALKDLAVSLEFGAPVGIQNDELSGNGRTLYHSEGSEEIEGIAENNWTKTIVIPGNWANVDGRLGVVSALGSGLAYQYRGRYNRDGAREDYLCGSCSEEARDFKAGETIARRAVVYYVETSPEETSRLANQVRIEGGKLRLALPEGGEHEVELE